MNPQTTNTLPSSAQRSPDIQHPKWDWANYIRYRPVYPDSLFDAIYTYHAAASPDNKFTTAHDVGAGPGNVSARLAERFAHVVLSEPNGGFLSVARERLSSHSHCFEQEAAVSESTSSKVENQEHGERKQDVKSKFTYLAESAEHSSVASDSIDLLVIAEALHWTDITASIAEFARQLKSGGTLCVLQYGPVWIMDNDKAQKVWEELFCHAVRDLFFGNGDRTGPLGGGLESERGIASPGNENYILAGRRCATGLDNVGFPSSHLRDGVVRVFTNTRGDPKKLGIAVRDAGLGEEEDAVGATDQRSFIEGDPDWMVEECDLAWLQGVYVSFFPGLRVEDDRERWAQLERALGRGTVTAAWPSVRILATRR
ncbi:S-adenosyl-L-methionine-dependent methyltransferase [Aspergillus insuetus]